MIEWMTDGFKNKTREGGVTVGRRLQLYMMMMICRFVELKVSYIPLAQAIIVHPSPPHRVESSCNQQNYGILREVGYYYYQCRPTYYLR